MSQDLGTKDIAKRLFPLDKTIENYRSRICQKLSLPAREKSLVLWINEDRAILSGISEL